jgi:hypothetical protein
MRTEFAVSFPRGAERRQFGRRQTYLHARIHARGRPSVPCIMRDISEGGALLQVDHPQWLPSRFRLRIEADGTEADCEVMRRTEDSVGVRFLTPVTINLPK